MGSDLLIHESTYNNTHEDLAIRNRHSTVGDALDAAKKMNAKFTILTHFSQRYSIFPSEADLDNVDFSFALDFMQVRKGYPLFSVFV